MIEGEEQPHKDAVIYQRLKSVKSPATSIFTPTVNIGDQAMKGNVLGAVTDHIGDPITNITALADGTVSMLMQTPAVSKGETPATLAIKKILAQTPVWAAFILMRYLLTLTTKVFASLS